VLLVEFGVYKNKQDFFTGMKDSQNLLLEWGAASVKDRPYCLLSTSDHAAVAA
jgi:hypothetical protein